jgi:hypothetical protein
MVDQSQPSLRDSALGYAGAGIPVFPCIPGGKVPTTARGFHDATTDPEQISAWWSRHPTANIGMPTGLLGDGTGIDVLDVDERPTGSGRTALERARRAGLTDGWIRVVGTPSGGLHLHYPGTAQRNGSLRDQHLDFRGQGGYVLLPPADQAVQPPVHVRGRQPRLPPTAGLGRRHRPAGPTGHHPGRACPTPAAGRR